MFGAEDLGREDSEDARVRRLAAVPEEDQVAVWERYILDLFPELDAQENPYLESCRPMLMAEAYWTQVLKRDRDLRECQQGLSL